MKLQHFSYLAVLVLSTLIGCGGAGSSTSNGAQPVPLPSTAAPAQLPSISIPASAISASRPSGIPPLGIGGAAPLLYLTFVAPQNLTLAAVSPLSIALPAGVNLPQLQLGVAIFSIAQPALGWELNVGVPGTSSDTFTLIGQASPFTLSAGSSYVLALYSQITTSLPMPSASPGASATPYAPPSVPSPWPTNTVTLFH